MPKSARSWRSSFLLAAACLAAGAARASHPLLTEDTGVLDPGLWQLELHGEKSGHARELAAAIAYGVRQRVELELELPYHWNEVDGRGDAQAALKWRFWEQRAFSAVLKPALVLPAGREEQGLGAGRTGWAVDAVLGWERGALALLGHAGYQRNRNRIGERRALRHVSAALLWSAAQRLTLVLDARRDTVRDRLSHGSVRSLAYGLIYAVSPAIDLGVGGRKTMGALPGEHALLLAAQLRW